MVSKAEMKTVVAMMRIANVRTDLKTKALMETDSYESEYDVKDTATFVPKRQRKWVNGKILTEEQRGKKRKHN